MASVRITDLEAAISLFGDEVVEVSQKADDVLIAVDTISALSSDNSLNDSGGGFISAGFAVNDRISVEGFVNFDMFAGVITALTANKMTLAGTAIVDETAGNDILVSKWVSRRVLVSDLAGSSGGGIGYETATQWRVRTITPGIGGVGWGEVAFIDETGLPISSIGTPSASSEAVTREASYAYDGNGVTYWSYDLLEEDEIGSFWQITYDDPKRVRAVGLTPPDSNLDIAPIEFAIDYYSDSLADWVELAVLEASWFTDDEQIFTLPNTPLTNFVEEAPDDGQDYVRKNKAWVVATGGGGTVPPFSLGWGFNLAPASADTLFKYVFVEEVDFPDNWTDSAIALGANPTSNPYVITLKKNGADIGTISITSAGVTTFNTSGGATNFAVGDVYEATGGADATLANVAITKKGARA